MWSFSTGCAPIVADMSRTPARPHTRPRAVRLAVLPAAASLLALAACTGGSDESAAPTTQPAASSTSATTTTTTTTAPASTAALTGLPEDDATVLGRSVVAVKIDNAPEARPQVALDRADMIFEEPVEGGITRLMAIFQSRNAGEVGPVRSARVTDPSIVRALGGGALIFSGASSATYRRITGTPDVILREEGQGAGWRRDYSRRAPHNLMVDQSKMRASLGKKLDDKPQRQFSFALPKPAGGKAITSAHVAWSYTNADWTWGGGSKTWLRSQNGTKDRLTNGKQLAVENVVIMQVRTVTNPGLHDVNGALTPLPDLDDGGKVWVLRDGRVYVGTWSRAGVDKPFTIAGTAGKKLALHPGQTWVELLPAPSKPKLKS